jgi:electron transfer flavoprotein alpha/beta subunit
MRYATIPGIRAASKKEIRGIPIEACGFTVDQSEIHYANWKLPDKRAGCKMIEGDPELQAAELVRLLREEVSLI